MNLALAAPTRIPFSRARLAAGAATVAIALVLTAMFGEASTVADTAPVSPAVTAIEEPWVPGVMTFSGEPAPRTAPISFDDLDPNCFCIGFF